MTMPWLALGDDLAGGHVQGGKEVGGTVTDVAMRDAFDVSEPEGQERLGSLQRLSLAFLVDAEHHRVVGRVEVDPTMSWTFSAKNGSVESLKCFCR